MPVPVPVRAARTCSCVLQNCKSTPSPALRFVLLLCAAFLLIGQPHAVAAQEPPYFVAYSSTLEEPGNLEIAFKGLAASPKNANGFMSHTLELEYGVTAWWTTELYLQGQSTVNDSTVFTGFRSENRIRPLPTEHWINPVLYVEYENINAADKSLMEIVGNDTISDLQLNNAETRPEIERELEGKLILSSNAKGWNFSENFIAEKNLSNEPWEFGYALATSRPLAFSARSHACTLCRQNFSAGAELYGRLGTTQGFGLEATSHYAGPTIGFNMPHGPTLSFSPQLGLNDNSAGVLWHFKVSYEIQQFRDWFRRDSSRRGGS